MTPLRLSLHREIDNVADQAPDFVSLDIVRELASDVVTHLGGDPQSERVAMVALAGFIVAYVEAGDQAATA